jgi:hypothetical protein
MTKSVMWHVVSPRRILQNQGLTCLPQNRSVRAVAFLGRVQCGCETPRRVQPKAARCNAIDVETLGKFSLRSLSGLTVIFRADLAKGGTRCRTTAEALRRARGCEMQHQLPRNPPPTTIGDRRRKFLRSKVRTTLCQSCRRCPGNPWSSPEQSARLAGSGNGRRRN